MKIGFHVFPFKWTERYSKISVSLLTLLVTAVWVIWVNTRTLAAVTHLITTATVTIAFAFEPAINAVAAFEAVIAVTFVRFETFAPFGICNRVMENTS